MSRVPSAAHYDDSPEYPANPDPSKAVHWGLQSCGEMMIGYLDFVPTDEDWSQARYADVSISREWIVAGGVAAGRCLMAAVAVLFARPRGTRTVAGVES